MKKLKPNEGLKLFDIKWQVTTAGPSPNGNKRIEVFLLGCQKAMKGYACKGCFNSPTWDASKAEWSWDPIELADMINEKCDPNNKYITIGGGEPTDQIEPLINFCKRLKEHGFHIMMYTWKNLMDMINKPPVYTLTNEQKEHYKNYIGMSNAMRLLKYLDIIVDGEFKQDKCLYQEDLGDGMLSSIGSGNQIIWDIKRYNEDKKETNKDLIGFKMEALAGLYVKPDTNDLVYITKE